MPMIRMRISFNELILVFADWFTGLFGGETTTKAPPIITTTRSPLLANALQSPHQWLNLLASHMATTTVKPPRMKTETPKRVKYDDYQVWRVTPSTQAHVDFLREYKMSSDGERIHWLKGPSMRWHCFKLHLQINSNV